MCYSDVSHSLCNSRTKVIEVKCSIDGPTLVSCGVFSTLISLHASAVCETGTKTCRGNRYNDATQIHARLNYVTTGRHTSCSSGEHVLLFHPLLSRGMGRGPDVAHFAQ